jgi:hypothetical protein
MFVITPDIFVGISVALAIIGFIATFIIVPRAAVTFESHKQYGF